MNTIDTRDLIQERDTNKQTILDAFLDEFEQYVDMTDSFEDIRFEEEELESFVEHWADELNQIREVDELEDEISSSEFDYGLQLIDSYDFTEYCQELLEDIGDLPRDLPGYISNNIDWDGVAHDLSADYSYVDFRGTNFLYRD